MGLIRVNLNQICMYHTLGFGVVRMETVRLWVGPQLGICCAFGKGSGITYLYEPIILTNVVHKNDLNYSSIGVSLGLSAGVNFNFGRYYTVFIEGGVRIAYNDMKVHVSYLENSSLPKGSRISSLKNYGYDGYISVGILFRIDDTY